MHPELENLLSIALQDGVLSEKEREILFRRAEKLGVDMDEFEMELEGRVPAQDSKKKLSPNLDEPEPNRENMYLS